MLASFREVRMTGSLGGEALAYSHPPLEIDDITDGQSPLRLRYEHDGIARTNFTFMEYGAADAGTTTEQKALHDFRLTESDAKLEAGHPRFRGDKLRRSHPEAAADPNVLVEQTLDALVLVNGSPRKLDLGTFTAPICGVLVERQVSSEVMMASGCGWSESLGITRSAHEPSYSATTFRDADPTPSRAVPALGGNLATQVVH
jgi:hypothetical protein